MITVKLFGLLRVESGIKQETLEAACVKDVLQHLSGMGIPEKTLRGCVVFVNGESAHKRKKLKNGDLVVLMPPVAGG